MTYDQGYLTAELDGDDMESLRLGKTSISPGWDNYKTSFKYDTMPWPAVGGGSGQVMNAAVEESKEPEPGRPNQAAATAAMIAEDAVALIDEFGRIMGKDFGALKNKLRENDINSVSELAALSEADLTDLGFTVGLK